MKYKILMIILLILAFIHWLLGVVYIENTVVFSYYMILATVYAIGFKLTEYLEEHKNDS